MIKSKTIKDIGIDKTAAIVSYSTGNTRAGWQDVQREIPTLLNLGDCCHHIQLTIQDINCIGDFQDVIYSLLDKGTILLMLGLLVHWKPLSFFTKSNYSSAHLKKAHEDVGLGQGLVKIGKTHFVTHWSASVALEKKLELIKELVHNKTIKPNVGHFHESQLYLDDDLKRIKQYRNSLKRMCHIAGLSWSLPFTLRLLSCLHGPYGTWNHHI